ncbi:hypothetical protein [Helicobacter sp. T3_23-1056]
MSFSSDFIASFGSFIHARESSAFARRLPKTISSAFWACLGRFDSFSVRDMTSPALSLKSNAFCRSFGDFSAVFLFSHKGRFLALARIAV